MLSYRERIFTWVRVFLRHRGVRHARARLVRDRGALVVGLACVYALRQREQGQLFAHRVLGRGTGRVPGEQLEVHIATVALERRGQTRAAGHQQTGGRGRRPGRMVSRGHRRDNIPRCRPCAAAGQYALVRSSGGRCSGPVARVPGGSARRRHNRCEEREKIKQEKERVAATWATATCPFAWPWARPMSGTVVGGGRVSVCAAQEKLGGKRKVFTRSERAAAAAVVGGVPSADAPP